MILHAEEKSGLIEEIVALVPEIVVGYSSAGTPVFRLESHYIIAAVPLVGCSDVKAN